MNIVCLGWGSLIWNSCDFPVLGCWSNDGPILPIEFARESNDRRITLVIAEGVSPVTVLWCNLLSANINEAKCSLAKREGIRESNIKDSIGFWSPDKNSAHCGVEAVGTWAQSRDVEAVVWTALEPGFKKNRGAVPDIGQIINHIQSLHNDTRLKAEEYVRKAPQQIKTNYRTAIEQEFGWTPIDH